jgi:hypothetical protein
MRIYPSTAVMQALDCGLAYGIDPIRGELSSIDDLIVRACVRIPLILISHSSRS